MLEIFNFEHCAIGIKAYFIEKINFLKDIRTGT